MGAEACVGTLITAGSDRNTVEDDGRLALLQVEEVCPKDDDFMCLHALGDGLEKLFLEPKLTVLLGKAADCEICLQEGLMHLDLIVSEFCLVDEELVALWAVDLCTF